MTESSIDDELQSIVDKLQRGASLEGAIAALKKLSLRNPKHSRVQYNLGLALSDIGDLPEAVMHLKIAAKLEPGNVHAHTGLGTAYARMSKWKLAKEAMKAALELNPDDPYAQRTMGTTLMQLGELDEGLRLLRKAHEALPSDPTAMMALASGLMKVAEQPQQSADAKAWGELAGEADELLKRYLGMSPDGPMAEMAETARTQIAQSIMRRRAAGGPRHDVVMYIVGALKRFEGRDADWVRNVGLEIAVLGRSGLDINDPDHKYRLKALEGEFSGIHLLAIMYAALRQVDPTLDVGVDFRAEYDAAVSMRAIGF